MRFLSLFLLSIATSATALAHGPQLQITNSGGKIVTNDVFLDGPYAGTSPARSVYVMPALQDAGIWYSRPNTAERPIVGGPEFYSGPGLAFGSQAGTSAAFAAGESFTLHFTAGLLSWEGAGFIDPGTEQIRAFRGAPTNMSASSTTSDAAPLESLSFPEISSDYSLEAHNTARFQFLGDGSDPLVPPEDGLYLLSLRLSSTELGLEDSDEFFFLLHKNASAVEIMAAVDALGFADSAVQYLGTVVPEPSTLAGGLFAVGSLLVGRNRKN